MTNKPMLSVERELIAGICDDFEAGRHLKACAGASKLRAILEDQHRPPPVKLYCNVSNVHITCNEDGSYTINSMPAAQHQGGVTLEQVLNAYDYANSHPHKYLRGTTNWCAAVAHALNVQRTAPVADHTQCEECKGWGYHENHYEGGGTECGECGGSGNATVAVVMTGEQILEAMRQSLTDADGGYVFDTAKDDVIAAGRALLEVARLNGVKP